MVFSPAARLEYESGRRVAPYLEYYSSMGSVAEILPLGSQFHQILPGAEIHLRDNLTWSVGVGIGLTSKGDRIVYKSRLEWHLGHKATAR